MERTDLQKIENWFSKFSSKLEDALPNMEGYIAKNNIQWMINELKKQEKDAAVR
ncbi:hypothetical protein AAXE64_27685 [Priestia megaterium]|uniref:hypothetical protein n=1 Tax=Priestia megaterium TaxID=1404 RepID=UPI003D011F7B